LGKDFRYIVDNETLVIVVRNKDNMGKYVLTVGNVYAPGNFAANHATINADFQKPIGPKASAPTHWFVLFALLAVVLVYAAILFASPPSKSRALILQSSRSRI
jgi:fructoselysine-6-P-deglycase FrlB-like protein